MSKRDAVGRLGGSSSQSAPPDPPGRFEPGRVASFSDGVMAIAITLLILNLRLPDLTATSEAGLQSELRGLEAPFIAFLLSFAIIAVWWNSHHRLFAALAAIDRGGLMLNFAFLAAVAFLPFPTSVFGRYASFATAIILYAATNVVIGGAVLAMWWHADRNGLLAENLDHAQLRQSMAYAASAPIVFGLSIPIAVASPDLAPWSWNAVWILILALQGRRRWRRSRAGRDQAPLGE